MKSLIRIHFSLVELLVVIAIFTVLLSMLMPTLSRSSFIAKVLKCSHNLKAQGIAYTLYCEDNNDFYPREDEDGYARHSIYDYKTVSLPKAMEGLLDGADNVPVGSEWQMAAYVDVMLCPLSYEHQAHPKEKYRRGKSFYGLFFNSSDPYSAAINVDPGDRRRMRKLGDTWTWDLVAEPNWWTRERGLKFNVLAMDHNKYEQWKIWNNHFWDAPDLIPNDHWHESRVAHNSRLGEGHFNFLFDDGSVKTERASLSDCREGWNVRDPSGRGSERWMLPREFAVGP